MVDEEKLKNILQHFNIDTANSNEEEIWIDIPGTSSICIKNEDNYLKISVHNFVTAECVAEMTISENSLMSENWDTKDK